MNNPNVFRGLCSDDDDDDDDNWFTTELSMLNSVYAYTFLYLIGSTKKYLCKESNYSLGGQ